MSFNRIMKMDGVHHLVFPNKKYNEFVCVYSNTLFLLYESNEQFIYAVLKGIDKSLLKAYLYGIIEFEKLLEENEVEFYKEVKPFVLEKIE